MIASDRCSVCGAELLLGGVKYNVQIKITSAFDGFLPEVNEENDEERRKQIERLIHDLDAMSVEDAEAEVYQEINLVLCPSCRRRVLRTLAAVTGREISAKPKEDQLLQ